MGIYGKYYKNGSGVNDPTAYKAIMNATLAEYRTEKNINELINDILIDCERHGFYIEGKVTFVSKGNCRVYKKEIKKLEE